MTKHRRNQCASCRREDRRRYPGEDSRTLDPRGVAPEVSSALPFRRLHRRRLHFHLVDVRDRYLPRVRTDSDVVVETSIGGRAAADGPICKGLEFD
jgi:hypothetical protein